MSAALANLADPAPSVALDVHDGLRRRGLERMLRLASPEDADVMLVALSSGEAMPAAAASFEGPLLLLSDDPVLAADRAWGGVLPLAASEPQIVAAIAAVAVGLTVRAHGAAPEPAGFAPPDHAGRPLLTPREVEVLAAVGQGMSNKAIARRLSISTHTVKYYLESIFQKLDVRSRAEAVTRGLRLGVQVL